MKRYFRTACDIGLGPGYCYQEFDDQWATRQVEIYRDRTLSSMEEDAEWGMNLSDQPLSEIDLSQTQEISAVEFEEAWDQAKRK